MMRWLPFHDTNRPARLPPPEPAPGTSLQGPGPGASAGPLPGGDGPGDPAPTHDWVGVLRRQPTTLFLYGPSRRVVSLGLFAFAQLADPRFLWVDICVAGEAPATTDPSDLGWVSSERLVQIDRLESLRPNSAAEDLNVAKLISAEESGDSVRHLISFLSLPEPTQELLTSPPVGRPPGLVAVTNTQRLMGVYSTAHVAPILEAHRRAGYSLFIGYAETPGPGRMAFDYVVRLDAESPRDWADSHLFCEKGSSSGPFRTGADLRIADVPFMADVFRRALGTD